MDLKLFMNLLDPAVLMFFLGVFAILVKSKFRRLADALERGDHFTIRVAGETVRVSADAVVSIQHERAAGAEELEFQRKWSRPS